jgi:hypothetical protein
MSPPLERRPWPSRPRLRLAVALLAAVAAGCGAPGAGRVARPSLAGAPQVETRLFFGLVDEPGWRAFVAEVVTPRFPEGLTVFDARGQYRFPETGRIVREDTRVLLLLHDGGAAANAAIAEIVADYRRRFAERSVLRVDAAVGVTF